MPFGHYLCLRNLLCNMYKIFQKIMVRIHQINSFFLAQISLFSQQCPGCPCIQNAQCAGFSAGFATCAQSACQCAIGSMSNGVSCVQQQVQWSARSSCSQFISPCMFKFSVVKRKPELTAQFDNETIPGIILKYFLYSFFY